MGFGGFGEILPDPSNRMFLDKDKKDKWGIPMIVFDAAFGENELAMRKDMMASAVEMLEVAGFKNVSGFNRQDTHPGLGIHDMGTARMGKTRKPLYSTNSIRYTIAKMYLLRMALPWYPLPA
jgi:choline dehydrogenase-like flavoprotein